MESNHEVINAKKSAPANEIGTLLKKAMSQQSISIRGLSALTGISAATISRIITGKQAANIRQLQEFAKHLGLSMEKLLQSVGVAITRHNTSGNTFLMEIIQDIMIDLNINYDTVVADIQKDLNELEQYAGTKEGKNIIADNFPQKIAAMDGAGAIIKKLNYFYARFCSDDMCEEKKAVVGSALLYFSLTIDVIPDYCFPFGYLDDAIAAKMVEKKLSQMKYV